MDDTSNIEGRISNIEKRLSALEAGRVLSQADQFRSAPQTPKPPEKPNRLLMWLQDDWLMKLGAFVLLLALAWFVNYAFANNWVGPMGRVSIGLIFGVALLAVGTFVIGKRPIPGQVICVISEITIMLTVLAARFLYDIFTPATALAMCALTAIAMAIIAVKRNAMALGILSLIGGAVAPLFTNSDIPNYTVLLSYGLIINLGTLLFLYTKQWKITLLLSTIITFAYSTAHWSVPVNEGRIFLGLYFFTLLSLGLVSVLRSQTTSKLDIITNIAQTVIFIFFTTSSVIPDHLKSVAASFAAICIGLLVAVNMKNANFPKNSILTYSTTALALIVAATVHQLNGQTLIIALLGESLLLTSIVKKTVQDTKILSAVSYLQVIPGVMALGSISYYHFDPINTALFNEFFFTLLVATLVFGFTYALIRKTNRTASIIHLVFANVFGVSLIWLTAYHEFAELYASGIAMVIYALVGVIGYFKAVKNSNKGLLVYSSIILGLVALRLIVVDVWKMELAARVVTFTIIGLILILTAFFSKKTHEN